MSGSMAKKSDNRVAVAKTWKLYIGGAFPRSESGRSMEIRDKSGGTIAHVCRASRKDLREAVEKATSAADGWSRRTGYNRGQILYRMAEMAEGRSQEIAEAISGCGGATLQEARKETTASIERLVSMAGWTDKFEQVLGCRNPVAGPFHNMSIPEPIGVIGVIAPPKPSLLGLISLIAPAIATGNSVVALGSQSHPLPTVLLGEICATSDVPDGVINLLTGEVDELLPHFSTHRGFGGVVAAGLGPGARKELELGAIDALTRVDAAMDRQAFEDAGFWHSPRALAPFVEIKTMWHPVGC